MLHHQQPVANADPERPAAPSLTDHQGDDGHSCLGESDEVLGYCPGDAALFRRRPGKGSRGVDEGYDRKMEPLGLADQAERLAITLRIGHAEITHGPLRRTPKLSAAAGAS